MIIEIPYGHKHIAIDIPEENILDIIKTEMPKHFEDEKEIILDALKNPIASQRLLDLAKGKKSAAILVSDVTRPCPSYKFLPFILDELEAAKIQNVSIIFGLGIHRKQTEEERLKLAGDYVAGKARQLIDSTDYGFKLIGHTKAGTPIEVCGEARKYDLLIATGNLEYHYFAGYSGGAKAVVPGICSRRTIQANHSLMLDDRAVTGNYRDNPLRQDLEEAGRMVGIDFLFNVILDDKKRIISAVSGKNNEAHLRGIELYDSQFKRSISEKADVVITSSGGHPKDINLYQAQKALDNVKGIVKEGGEIILIASCAEGYGEKVFEEWMADAKDYEKLNRRIKKKFILGGHKAVAISKLLSKTKVLLHSCFDRKETERLGFIKAGPPQSYLDKKIASAADLKVVVVPGGSFIQYQS
jgi:nickel-dependent lactate racemase